MVLPGATIEYVSLAALFGSILLALVALRRLDEGDVFAPLRDRFVFGVPWGTVLVVVGLWVLYVVVQGGNRPGGPVVVGFRSWSVWYPQGILLSSFTHSSGAHLRGNLLGTVAFAPLVEYVWGHYRNGVGPSPTQPSWVDRLLGRPAGRIALFVVFAVLVGILGSLFVPGAVVGFSGVVFAFAGATLVSRPLGAILAIVGIQVLSLFQRSLVYPITTARSTTRFVSPSWANVALQGHAFGLAVGALLAIVLLRSRGRWPRVRWVFFATLVFAVTRSMWALNWPLGGERFVLYRAIGTALVVLLAVIVAVAVSERDPPLVGRIDLSMRESALGLLIALVAALALASVPYTVATVSPGEDIDTGVEVRDYTVSYAENVENGYIAAIEVPYLRDSFSVNQSGVVVTSDRRQVWELDTPAQQLALNGQTTVAVGDATWRETVVVNRTTWTVLGGNSTYKVIARHDGERTLLFAAEPAESPARIANRQFRIEPTEAFYDVVVIRPGATSGPERARIPSANESVDVDGLTFVRENRTLLVREGGTEIPVAEYRLADAEE